eukprot:CAMPEP_0177600636 /NCGR_PEP_ID=MMETSP0419_2-20121207/13770_1 /TAXON_ID=582737 /ORGANISM="Tetraselmis sp., Strain GSL018" /LENGTH=298 /DNA_ID=CAMNT_0019093725 /DNA_START=295 /DNA_END=1191 /DNA_ORIENTATION=-
MQQRSLRTVVAKLHKASSATPLRVSLSPCPVCVRNAVLLLKPHSRKSPSALQHENRRGRTSAKRADSDLSTTTTKRLQVELDTKEAKRDLKFGGIVEGRGRVIVITSVRPESEASKQGVQPGSRLVAISDPVRNGELWELNERASLRFVRDSLQMRVSGRITLVVELPDPGDAATSSPGLTSQEAAAEASAGAPGRISTGDRIALLTMSSEDEEDQDAGGRSTEEQERQQQQQRRRRQRSEVEMRIQARKDYLGEVSQRDDTGFFLGLAAAIVLPAATILAIAYASGYLDALQRSAPM